MSEGQQKRLQVEVEKYKSLEKEFQKALGARQQLDAQLNENSLVKEELELLTDSSPVYKLIGPSLIKQNLNEARQTVQKRMDYITSELRRQEGLMKDTEKKQEVNREAINKIQHLMQQQQVKAAAKA